MKHRANFNRITSIYTEQGVKLEKQDLIQEEFLKFYKNLMGTSAKVLPSANVQIIRDGPTLSLQQLGEMIRDIKDEEITKSSTWTSK